MSSSKTGRPAVIIDWETVDQLCELQCIGEEIAAGLGCDYDTLAKNVKDKYGCSCSDYIRQKAQGGKASLRRSQWNLAKDGNATMLIWLGKQYLEQSDKQEINHDKDGDLVEALNNLADALPD